MTRYNSQVGHPQYKKEIALSWIRKDLEERGDAFSNKGVSGASNLRTPFLIQMHTLEKLILEAFNKDPALFDEYKLDVISKQECKAIGEYLFNFFEGVKLSLGLIHPSHRAYIETFPVDSEIDNYWDLALYNSTLAKQQHILHNVGLRAIVNGLLVNVMSNPKPDSPQQVAEKLAHMRGIPWHDGTLRSKKDDWVKAISDGLNEMFDSRGTTSRNYTLKITKEVSDGPNDEFKMTCLKFDD